MSLRGHVFLLITLLNLSYSTANYGGNETDRFALLAFKSNLHDPQDVLNSWNHSIDFCKWQGVTCGRLHKRVTMLNLTLSGLSGSLTPHIGNLSFLQQLYLPQNNFTGKIPDEIGRLFRLQWLSLLNNSFEGEIPANLSHCTSLKVLDLRRNKLVGEIPREVGSLSKLTVLALSRNNLSGEIPSFIGNLSSLETFYATYNLFKGSIPNTLGALRNLTMIDFGVNKLSGTIPSSIYNLSSLNGIGLADNELVGILPQDLGLSLPYIQQLLMWGNYFNGTIPLSLSNASELMYIDFGGNHFAGKVPYVGALKNLMYFRLDDNNLGTGEGNDEMSILIDSLTNCTLLTEFAVSDNNLAGRISNSVGNLSTQLQIFAVSSNRLYGVIPSGLGNLVNLEIIEMEQNQFIGKIPNDIGNLQKLDKLYLYRNQLSGPIPFSLGNMSILSLVYLGNNKLDGSIPSSLGNCKNLLLLNLSHNNLSGTIPKELFDASSSIVALDLSNNHLVGPIPSEVGKLKNLRELYVSRNELSGEIPKDLGICSALEVLYFEGNFFNGSIPLSLKSLSSLQTLDLSNNNLSGTVPKFLENFPLNYLNLSFNDFEGELPTQGVFLNASAISVNGNSQLCGGISDLRLPRCKVAKSKRRRLSLLHIIIISVGCSIFAVSTVSLFIFCWTKNKRTEKSSPSSPKESFLKVSYGDLVKATNGFSPTNIIGLGSFGSVYKGILDPDKMVVAVKVLNLERYGAIQSFMTECKALRNIRHRNLLKIITSCSSIDFNGNDFKALVYEFMPNGSLERWLHSLHSNKEKLNLRQRIDIAVDVAYALEYLHHQCGEPIIHCDLKPSNVLLDVDMVAHVGDFGLAKFTILESSEANQSRSIGVKGTIGYTAPEYGLGNEVSTKGDIYSYGILLLEMMIGKSPIDPMFSEGLSLHSYAMNDLPNNVMKGQKDVAEVSANNNREEHSINDNMLEDCLGAVVKIGVACSMESPQDRMDLNDVIHQLQLVKSTLEGQ